MTSTNTKRAEPGVSGNGSQGSVLLGDANTSTDTAKHLDHQVIKDVEDAIEASTECERILARRWLAQHRATMSLEIYRDNLTELGKTAKAFWGGRHRPADHAVGTVKDSQHGLHGARPVGTDTVGSVDELVHVTVRGGAA